MPIDHYQGDMPIADDRRDDRPFRNQDPMMAADIESIEDSIPDEDSFPDRSMDLSRVTSPDGMDDAEIEAAIEAASFPEAYGTDAWFPEDAKWDIQHHVLWQSAEFPRVFQFSWSFPEFRRVA